MKVQKFKDFLDRSPTTFHACLAISEQLKKHGFEELFEKEPWQIIPGKKYFVVRRARSVIAFDVPENKPQKSLHILSHVDSPSLKLKPHFGFTKEGMSMLQFETYGSPILASWIGRNLYLAGIIYAKKGSKIVHELVSLQDTPFIIPNLAIHLDRKVNEQGLLVQRQEGLQALFDMGKSDVRSIIQKTKEPTAYHLYAIPLEKSCTLGSSHELISSYRLDNLASCYACLEALCSNKEKNDATLNIASFFDNEEIGSESDAGASSSFYDDVFTRVCFHFNMNVEETMRCKASSFALSCDVTHAVHPQYIERSEPLHKLEFTKGIVIKDNADERYASSDELSCIMQNRLFQNNIPYQFFSAKNDIPAGTTVGPIHAAKTGIATLDIGIPILGMHAAMEVVHIKDVEYLVEGLKVFLNE